MSKKKIGVIIAVVIVIAAAAGAGAWYLLNGNIRVGDKNDKVFVEKVSSLTSANSGAQNRYSGVVEPQESWKVDKDMEREIKEVFVEEGDMVEEGDSLFEYNMDDVKAEISQGELDLEEMKNEITDLNSQISQLTKERNSAPSDDKFRYTAEIQGKQNEIKQKEYNIESKKAELEKKQESIDNAVVTSKIAGVVKSINKSSGSDDFGNDNSYMTILAVGDYRIKGTISESNVQMLSEDQPVILRSRIDESQTWTGTITKIDTQSESTDNNNDMMMDDSSGGGEKATKYPFYVTLDSTEGLMMGQHLFIELDQGQTEEKEGIWLFEGYIVREYADGTPVESGMNAGEGMDLDGSDFGEDVDVDGFDGGEDIDIDGSDIGEDVDVDGSDMGDDESLEDDDSGEDADTEDDSDVVGNAEIEANPNVASRTMSANIGDGADADFGGFDTDSRVDEDEGIAFHDMSPEDSDADTGDSNADAEGVTDLNELMEEGEDGSDTGDLTDMNDLSAEGSDASGNASGVNNEDIITYVWAANDKNKLEKRKVELGEYDEMTGEYEILSGLTEDDYIAFPMEGLYEGVTTVTNIEDVDYTSSLYNQGEEGEGSEGSEDVDGSEDGSGGIDESFGSDATLGEEGFTDGDMSGEDMSDEDMSDDGDLSGSEEDAGLDDADEPQQEPEG